MIEKNTSPTKFAHFLYCPIKLVFCLTVYVFGSWGFVQLFFVVAVYQHPVFLFWIVSWCDPLSSDVVPCVLMWPRVSWGDPLCPEAEVTPYILRWPPVSWGDPRCPEVTLCGWQDVQSPGSDSSMYTIGFWKRNKEHDCCVDQDITMNANGCHGWLQI